MRLVLIATFPVFTRNTLVRLTVLGSGKILSFLFSGGFFLFFFFFVVSFSSFLLKQLHVGKHARLPLSNKCIIFVKNNTMETVKKILATIWVVLQKISKSFVWLFDREEFTYIFPFVAFGTMALLRFGLFHTRLFAIICFAIWSVAILRYLYRGERNGSE
jgi:hypothetical protein